MRAVSAKYEIYYIYFDMLLQINQSMNEWLHCTWNICVVLQEGIKFSKIKLFSHKRKPELNI